ncbi:aminotransferase class V-fold PLP-dependent enzyme [Sphingomonas sp.]|uniref:aminotransferase class V-fold PLP-dependent enzyme n=1 Tax=Sphingomonas sp. TaxID=28214 RepID=UPI0017B45422|nr:aminotransferase class V-fold PLP-dependent enzyme [Sphingomonas sp.]MBA3511697.1 aminotransferase class V-fold PLP-dependent enzyme [Sphingomonas sp.]
MDRRQFLAAAAAGGAAVAVLPSSASSQRTPASSALPDRGTPWAAIKQQFDIKPGIVQMSAFYLASHPRPVRDAIERHRLGLDRDAHSYIDENVVRLEQAIRDEAARYMGVDGDDLALTDSTTMGLGLVYSGFALKPGEEILTDTRDHIVTNLSASYGAEQSGGTLRQAALYADPATVTADEVAENVRRNLRDNTRLLAVTWVHSGTGVKMPIARIAEVVRAHNRGKSPDRRTYLAVDGVHGLGIENVAIPALGADFFIAGTHKWLTGPRGTGLVWAKPEAWALVKPTIPTFDPMWRSGPVDKLPAAAWHTPGGFHSFEHRWALAEAFRFHSGIGKDRVAARIHELNSLAKSELAKMPKVKLHTPRSAALSAGIITFEVDGYTPRQVVQRLHDKHIIASVIPGFYKPLLARIAPSLLTLEEDVGLTMRAIAAL